MWSCANFARRKWDSNRLKELEELMAEFLNILIYDGKSPVTALVNCLNTLKSERGQGKIEQG